MWFLSRDLLGGRCPGEAQPHIPAPHPGSIKVAQKSEWRVRCPHPEGKQPPWLGLALGARRGRQGQLVLPFGPGARARSPLLCLTSEDQHPCPGSACPRRERHPQALPLAAHEAELQPPVSSGSRHAQAHRTSLRTALAPFSHPPIKPAPSLAPQGSQLRGAGLDHQSLAGGPAAPTPPDLVLLGAPRRHRPAQQQCSWGIRAGPLPAPKYQTHTGKYALWPTRHTQTHAQSHTHTHAYVGMHGVQAHTCMASAQRFRCVHMQTCKERHVQPRAG